MAENKIQKTVEIMVERGDYRLVAMAVDDSITGVLRVEKTVRVKDASVDPAQVKEGAISVAGSLTALDVVMIHDLATAALGAVRGWSGELRYDAEGCVEHGRAFPKDEKCPACKARAEAEAKAKAEASVYDAAKKPAAEDLPL